MSDVDLTECAREPIQVPGSIQPHGALVGVDERSMEIVLESANAGATLGAGGSVRGRTVGDVLGTALEARLRSLAGADVRDANPIETRLADGRAAYCIAHRSEGLVVLELEPVGEDEPRFTHAYRRLVRRFEWLRRATTAQEVCDLAAREVRALTGFDRVMIYRFDSHDDGEVIAEDVADGVDSFLGLHFPESDIPAQARALYVQNPIRLIVDAAYEPVPLEPATNPRTGGPLDMSHAALRSVSPVHREYLANMGVGASMSISLVAGERLWGLVACHHRQPYHVPYGTRLVGEFLAHVLSARVAELARSEALSAKNRSYAIQSHLIELMVEAPQFQEGLSEGRYTLADLLPCDGAAVVYGGRVTRVGSTPDEADVQRLAEALAARDAQDVFQTDCLGRCFEFTAPWTERAAGIVAVPISKEGHDQLLWFRGERRRSVRWAGDPNKAASPSSPGGRLTPRGSFDEWVEETRGCSDPWLGWEVEIASDFRTALVASVVHQASELQRLNASLVEASQQKDRFLATVSHELCNPLNAIVGWVRVARMGIDAEKMDKALATIERNAEAQAALIEDLLDVSRITGGRLNLDLRPCNLHEVIDRAIESLDPVARSRKVSVSKRIVVERSDIVGDPGRLQQVVWNLLSNALKFSEPDGRVELSLGREGSMMALEVLDEGAGIEPDLLPVLFEPFRQAEGPQRAAGLGLGLSIVKSIVELHGGTVSAASPGPGGGATFRVLIPVAALQAPESDADDAEPTRTDVDLGGCSILVVEDQEDSAELIASVLSSSGARAATAGNGELALAALRRGSFDAVVSDLDMPVLDGFGLLAALRADERLRDLPVVALTAFARRGDRARAIEAGFRQYVTKPVDADELLVVLGSLLGRLT